MKPSFAKRTEEVTSKLMPLIEWVNENIDSTELDELKKYACTFIRCSTIRSQDKVKTISTIQTIEEKQKLHIFLYNSMLKFEGLGVVGILPR